MNIIHPEEVSYYCTKKELLEISRTSKCNDFIHSDIELKTNCIAYTTPIIWIILYNIYKIKDTGSVEQNIYKRIT
jgi:hypothetical protein